jgi:excisionase family DNA binding protein
MTLSRHWFTISEASDVTGIDESTIRDEIRHNHLHPRRQGTAVTIVDAELERWLRVRFSSHPQVARRNNGSGSNGSARPGFSVEQWLHQTEGQKQDHLP